MSKKPKTPRTKPAPEPEPVKAKPSGLDAAAQVLKDAAEPMGCKDLIQTMLTKGLWSTEGKTPESTLNASIHREIRLKGKESRFRKAERGRFAFNG